MAKGGPMNYIYCCANEMFVTRVCDMVRWLHVGFSPKLAQENTGIAQFSLLLLSSYMEL